jgi:autotransporter-associated beta strand protein
LLQPSANISLVGTNCDFDVSNDAAMTLAGVITNTGTLLKTSGGVLTLVSNNTFTGSTIIAGGTLALADPLDIGAGSISNSVLINVTSNATLDVSGRGDQTLTLNSGQTLAGDGSINGNLVTTTGSVLMPGNGIGTLTVTNNITLAGAAVFELNRASSQNSSELVSILGTLTGGGTLAVTNAGPALQVGDTFQLFPSAVIGFAAISLPVTDANGYAYTWNTNIGVNGSISVASASIAVNPHPGPVQFTLSGRTLALSWPTNLGWELQEQTNSLATGLGTNWVVVAGSTAVTTTNITVNPTNGSMFFRLALPQP